MSDKLLPCPFCGGKAEFRSGSSTTPYIRCRECGGRTKSSYNETNLITAWNKRARETCHMEYCEELSYDELYPTEAYKCSVCGSITVEGKPNYCPNCGKKVIDR